MPIKKDGNGKRWVEMEFVVQGTPEQLWQAMATGEGYAAWFTRTEIEGRVGGKLRFDFGAMGSSSGEVTAWEPPHRLGFVECEWSDGAPPVATEITITSRAGGKCVVRMVHSMFSSSDDWDDQMEGFEGGWPAYFEVLRIYLLHFAGRKAASFRIMESIDGDQLIIWKRLLKELDLADPHVGERRATPPVPERLSGVIEGVREDERMRLITIRLETPYPGVAMVDTYAAGGRINVGVCAFVYGDDADNLAKASEDKWRAWLCEMLGSGT